MSAFQPPYDLVALQGDRRILMVHSDQACRGERCCIHNPSDHPLSGAGLTWRPDRRLMERTCVHGVGHPDPDHLAYVARQFGEETAWEQGIHGCDGCCLGDGRALAAIP